MNHKSQIFPTDEIKAGGKTTKQMPSNNNEQAYSLKIEDEYHKLFIHILIFHDFIEDYRKKTLEDPLAHEFNIDEDKMLLFADLSKTMKDDEPVKTTSKDLAKAYRSQHKKNPKIYPKVSYTPNMFRERLGKLRDLGLRYQILYNEVNEEIEKKKLEEEEKKQMEADAKFTYSLASRKSRKETIDPQRNPKMKDPFHRDALLSPIVYLTTTGRSFKSRTFTTHEKYLLLASQYMKKALAEITPDTLPDDQTKVKRIGLSEFDRQFKEYEMGECFEPDNIERFLMYAEHPDFNERFTKAKQRLEALNNENQNNLNRAIDQLLQVKKNRLDTLEVAIDKEKKEFKKVLNKCKEFDMERLRIMYEVHLQNEYGKLDSLLDLRKKELDTFYEQEIQKTTELYENQQQVRKVAAETELANAQQLMDDILPQPHLVPMLMLSDILQAEDLRDTCLRLLGKNFEFYYRDKHLGSQLISKYALQQLMTQIPTDKLKELADQYDYHFPREFVNKEIEYRKGILASEYKDLSVSELMNKLSEETLFSEVLSNEINSRKKKKPFVSLSPTFISPFLKCSDDNLSVELRAYKRYSCVHGTHPRTFEGWGKWYFEVYLDEFDTSYGSTISVGWDTQREPPLDGPIPGLTPGERNQFGYSWQSDGILHYEGKGVYIDEQFKEGDIIGCAIDQDKKSLTFMRNGNRVTLVRREHANRKVQEIKSIQIKDDIYCLYPAACLYSAKKNSRCKITFNFSGNFKYPAPQYYEAYGNERVYHRQMKQLELQKQKTKTYQSAEQTLDLLTENLAFRDSDNAEDEM